MPQTIIIRATLRATAAPRSSSISANATSIPAARSGFSLLNPPVPDALLLENAGDQHAVLGLILEVHSVAAVQLCFVEGLVRELKSASRPALPGRVDERDADADRHLAESP